MPKVSIIIPTYNHAKVIGLALEAVLAQTHPITEIIVVNDGSTDNTLEVLKKYSGQITLIDQKNAGPNAARNIGLRAATGDLVMCLDADVILERAAIEKLVQALNNHPEASYAYGSFYFGWKYFASHPFSAAKLREYNYIHTSALVRIADHPGFDEEIRRFQDWDVWLTMLAKNKTGIFVPEVLANIMVSGKSRIGSSWLPKMSYRIPWPILGYTPKKISNYFKARSIIKNKHQL